MRILLIAPPWFAVPPRGYGGIESVIALLADSLIAAGDDVTLLANAGSTSDARLQSEFAHPIPEHIGNPWYEARHVVAGYLRRRDYDLVHDHTGPSGLALGALLDGPPVVHTLHGPWTDEVAALHRMLAPGLAVVAISADQGRQAAKDIGLAGVVPNGIAVGTIPARLERRGQEGYLLFVGRANAEKGPEIAVQVARQLGRPLKMLIKINEPAEHAYWQDVVAPHLDGADVEVMPAMSTAEKWGLYAGADATVFPIQWSEPFGLVMVESMACGTPVVAFDGGSSSEVIADGETGYVLPPGDFDGMCAAIARVPRLDPAACRQRVEQCYSGAAMAAGYRKVYAEVVGRGARSYPDVREPSLRG